MFKFHIRGENVAITDAIRDYTETKLSKLEKYFSEDVTVHITAKVYPNKQAKAEVTIPSKDVTPLLLVEYLIPAFLRAFSV